MQSPVPETQAPPSVASVLDRRLRALVRTAPLLRVEANKGMRGRDLGRHDLRSLSLRAIDATIEHMGLGYGASRADLHDALRPWIRAAEPDIEPADLRDLADLVLDHLLNEGNRRLQFDEPYVTFADGSATARSVRFHLLREEEADDGSIVLKATTEAINLYAGMLEVDVEDAQTAAEAVLAAQIARGAIGSAVATARQARLRSIEYAETLRSTLRQVRRDVSQVDAARMLAAVASARTHLEERLRVERGLLDAVDERIADADSRRSPDGAGESDARDLVDLKDVLDDCRRRHLALHEDLLGITDTWLAEQERQRFRRPRASALPDLERDVFAALIALPLATVDAVLDDLLRALHPAQAPRVFHLSGLCDSLLAPRRRVAEADLDAGQPVLDDLLAVEARFAPDVVARVARLLAGGGTLGGLLARSRAEGDGPDVRQLLVLRALWAWDPDPGDALRARPVGALADPEFLGVDLSVGAS